MSPTGLPVKINTTVNGQVFGLGHRNNPGHRLTPIRFALARVGTTEPPAGGLDYRLINGSRILPAVFDQGPSGSCEGHACSAGVYASFEVKGKPLGFVPSMDDVYRLARCLDRTDVRQPLTDSGTEGNSVIRAIQEFGIQPMLETQTSDGRYSDVEMASMAAEPKLGALERDATRMLVGAYSILDSSQADVAGAYMQALMAFGPVPTASFVDTTVMNWDPTQPPINGNVNYQDPNGGGHKILCVGWRWIGPDGKPVLATTPGAVREWIIRNSWGSSYGDAGYFYATDDWLAQTDEREVYDVDIKAA